MKKFCDWLKGRDPLFQEEIIPKSAFNANDVFSKSGLSNEDIAFLKSHSAGVMTAIEYYQQCNQGNCPGKGGYSLGLTFSTGDMYSVGTHYQQDDDSPPIDWFDNKPSQYTHYKNAYNRLMPSEFADNENFLPKIVASGKPVVFFIPNVREQKSITERELLWFLNKGKENPTILKNVYFIFGAYDMLNKDVYDQYIKNVRTNRGDVGMVGGIMKDPKAHMIPGEQPNNPPVHTMRKHLDDIFDKGVDVQSRYNRWLRDFTGEG